MISLLMLFNFLSATVACGVGFYSYLGGKFLPRWIHHFFYFLLFFGILLSSLLGILGGQYLPLHYLVMVGLGILPFLPKGKFFHIGIGIFSFFLTGIQFLLFK